jgi:hypothetical protein
MPRVASRENPRLSTALREGASGDARAPDAERRGVMDLTFVTGFGFRGRGLDRRAPVNGLRYRFRARPIRYRFRAPPVRGPGDGYTHYRLYGL